jgi:hypothetical protein
VVAFPPLQLPNFVSRSVFCQNLLNRPRLEPICTLSRRHNRLEHMSLSVAAGNESRSANSFWDNVSDKVKQADKKALDEEMKYVGSQTSITDPTASKASESEASEESETH